MLHWYAFTYKSLLDGIIKEPIWVLQQLVIEDEWAKFSFPESGMIVTCAAISGYDTVCLKIAQW